MSEPLEETYFKWLYGQFGNLHESMPHRSYFRLCGALHRIPFEVHVEMDRNRVGDAVALRGACMDELGRGYDPETLVWYSGEEGPSVFEVLVGIARRCEFLTSEPVAEWMYMFFIWLRMNEFHDGNRTSWMETVQKRIYTWMRREYRSRLGTTGALFPWRRVSSGKDHRTTEIWYQLNHYLIEND